MLLSLLAPLLLLQVSVPDCVSSELPKLRQATWDPSEYGVPQRMYAGWSQNQHKDLKSKRTQQLKDKSIRDIVGINGKAHKSVLNAKRKFKSLNEDYERAHKANNDSKAIRSACELAHEAHGTLQDQIGLCNASKTLVDKMSRQNHRHKSGTGC